MTPEKLGKIFESENFWVGVLGSMLAAVILAIIVFIFRNSIRLFLERRNKGNEESDTFDSALSLSSPYAPFAFGVVQGRALRYFLTAVFIAYVGDILQIFYPFNLLVYLVSLYYIYLGLKWFFRIERRALEIINSIRDSSPPTPLP